MTGEYGRLEASRILGISRVVLKIHLRIFKLHRVVDF